MNSRWRSLHKILGLSVGTLIFLICLSGGVLVFKENIIALNLKSDTPVPSYSMNNLSQGLRQIISHHAPDDIYYIKTPTQGRRYWLLVTKDEHMHMYDGNTAEPVADTFNIQPVLHWLSHLHTELLIPRAGSTLITLIGIFTLLLMLAGFISWWPGRKGFKWQHLWTTPSRRGPALRQHRAWAIFCIPLLSLSVITGGGMSIQGAIPFLFKPAPKSTSTVTSPVEPTQESYEFSLTQLEVLLQKAQQALPNSEATMVSLPNAKRHLLRLRFRAKDEWHINGKTNVFIDTDSGDIEIKDIKNASAGRRILNTFYPLHSSYGLPTLYKTIVALTGIVSVWLAILGYMAWIKRRNAD